MKRKKDIALKNSIAHIDYKLMGTELAALLFENSQIHDLKPPFNTALKASRFPISVSLSKSSKPYSLKKSSQEVNEPGLYSFKNKKNAQSFINSIYQSFLNTDEDSIDFEIKRKQFVEKFGEELFNNFLSTNLNRLVPLKKTFMLKLNGRVRGEYCYLVVEDQYPKKLVFSSESNEVVDLNSTPQMQRMLYNYIKKFKLNIMDLGTDL